MDSTSQHCELEFAIAACLPGRRRHLRKVRLILSSSTCLSDHTGVPQPFATRKRLMLAASLTWLGLASSPPACKRRYATFMYCVPVTHDCV